MDVHLEGHYRRHWKCPLILETLNNSYWLLRKNSRPVCVNSPKVNFDLLRLLLFGAMEQVMAKQWNGFVFVLLQMRN